MPGEEEERHLGALGRGSEAGDLPGHVGGAAIGDDSGFETQRLERVAERQHIVHRIGEIKARAGIVRVPDQESMAALGRYRSGAHDQSSAW